MILLTSVVLPDIWQLRTIGSPLFGDDDFFEEFLLAWIR